MSPVGPPGPPPILPAAVMAIMLLVSCPSREVPPPAAPPPPDTVVVLDTVVVTDTVVRADTLVRADTVNLAEIPPPPALEGAQLLPDRTTADSLVLRYQARLPEGYAACWAAAVRVTWGWNYPEAAAGGERVVPRPLCAESPLGGILLTVPRFAPPADSAVYWACGAIQDVAGRWSPSHSCNQYRHHAVPGPSSGAIPPRSRGDPLSTPRSPQRGVQGPR